MGKKLRNVYFVLVITNSQMKFDRFSFFLFAQIHTQHQETVMIHVFFQCFAGLRLKYQVLVAVLLAWHHM